MRLKQKYILTYLIISIFLFSMAFKIVGLKQNEVFISTDEVNYIQAAMDMFHIFDSPFNLDNLFFRFFKLFIYQYGPMYILLNFGWMALLSAFKIPLTEFTFTMLNVLLGSLVSIIVFLLGKELHSIKAGLISSIFFIIIPISAGMFRQTQSSVPPGLFFLILSVYFLIKYFKVPTKKYALISSFFVGGYLLSDGQFLGILPLILIIGLYYSSPKFGLIKKVLNPYFLTFPLIFISPLIFVWVYYGIKNNDWTASLIGHAFYKTSTVGFSGFQLDLFQGMALSLGLVYFACSLIGYLYGLAKTMWFKKEGLLFFWATVYLVPWCFFITHDYASHRAYYLQGLVPLIFLCSIFFLDLEEYFHAYLINRLFKRFILFCLYCSIFIILLFTLSSTFDYVFNKNIGLTPLVTTGLFNDSCPDLFREGIPLCDTPSWCYLGTNIYKNWGSKTAGYYIRKNTGPNEAVYTEIGTPAARHYFGRPVFNSIHLWMVGEGNIDLKFNDLIKNFEEISTVVVRSCNYQKAGKYINDSFHKVAEVRSEDKPMLYIFSKQQREPVVLSTEKYDALFDKEFGNWKSLYLEDWLYYEGIDFNQSFKKHFE